MNEQPEVLADGTPARLGRYRLVRPISTGGMARVFEGRRESLAGVQPRVAIKVILPHFAGNVPFQELFVNEARIGSMLQHQNVVQIQDFDCEDGRYYLVMEYVDGITLRQVVSLCRRHGIPLSLDLVAEIGRQICEGLGHAHTAHADDGQPLNLVHRDIKPSNLMINPQGIVKVLDFGISKALFREEKDNAVRGTWGYMSPEQADGEPATAAADLFGLASVLYELASLAPLFPEKSGEKIHPLLAADEAARRGSRLGKEFRALSRILVRAFQRDPAARFVDADAMGRTLSDLVRDPVSTRDALIRLQKRLVELSKSDVQKRPASAVKPVMDASNTADAPVAGLPVAIGDARRPAPMPEPPASTVKPALPTVVDLRLVAVPLFFCVAVVVIGFTGWRLYKEQQDVSWAAPPAVQTVEEAKVNPAPDVAPNVPPSEPIEAVPLVENPGPVGVTAPVEDPSGIGHLTVSALPRAKVWVDGEFVRHTPMYRTPLSAGHHAVRLETDDGRTYAFQVRVRAGAETNRVWSFDQGVWMGEAPR